MLAGRYELPLSTASAGVRDADVDGYELALTLYPTRSSPLAIDPGLALANAGKAQVQM